MAIIYGGKTVRGVSISDWLASVAANGNSEFGLVYKNDALEYRVITSHKLEACVESVKESIEFENANLQTRIIHSDDVYKLFEV